MKIILLGLFGSIYFLQIVTANVTLFDTEKKVFQFFVIELGIKVWILNNISSNDWPLKSLAYRMKSNSFVAPSRTYKFL